MTPKTFKHLIGVSALALFMTGCAVAPGLTDTEKELSTTMSKDSFQPAPRSLRDGIETQELLAQAAFWMREYELNPADLEAAIKLSAAIRKVGNPQRAVEITQTTRALYPRDPYLTAEYAAALIASERSLDAMKPLDEALRYAPAYGRLWSLKGAALDQQGQYEPARQHYNRALQITPNDPSVMANMGLSYALSGDPQTAESWLRRAASIPGASQNVRQNLALVLQIQGKMDEAETVRGLAQQRTSQRLPNLNPRPAYTPQAHSTMPPVNTPQNRSSLRGQYNPQQNAQPNSMTATNNYPSSSFTAPPPTVTQQNSPSVRPQAQGYPVTGNTTSYASTAPYFRAQTASEAARLAAGQSGQRARIESVTPTQKMQQEELLAKIARHARTPSQRPPQSRVSSAQAAPHYPGRAQQPTSNPATYENVQAQPPHAYAPYAYSQEPTPQTRRGASRTRR